MSIGADPISRLGERVSQIDPGASAHWQHYHQNLKFTGNGFSGLDGFGGTGRRPTLLRSALHTVLQRPYNAMGERFRDFSRFRQLARQITDSQRREFDLDALRQAITLSFLHDKTPGSLGQSQNACVIGDGFGMMTALLLASGSADRIVLVNLTKTLLVDLFHLRLWMGEAQFSRSVALVEDQAELAQAIASSEIKVVAIQAADHELIRHCSLDLVINIASMQEMNPGTVAEYFHDLRTAGARRDERSVLYCCNREEKILPDGVVVRLDEYPWLKDDTVVLDELCPWHQKFYSARPPFYRQYDGPIRHRIVELSA